MPERKPLELVVYPPLEPDDKLLWRDTSTGRQYSAPMYRHPSGIIGNQPPHPREYGKRLTDAELAAESWKAAERVRSCAHPALHVQRANAVAKLETLHRFATHQHYDERDNQ